MSWSQRINLDRILPARRDINNSESPGKLWFAQKADIRDQILSSSEEIAMQEQFEQTNTPEMQSVTQWDELRREVYADCSSLLRTANVQERLNFDHMQIHFKNVYDSIRKDAVFAGEEPVSINASTGGNSEQSNTQNADLPERDSSRLNREDDRQPYLDAARHQGVSEVSNEQAAESPERFSSRMNREDDRQPYLDRERLQDYDVTAL